jgi:hypothetical protein
MHPPCRHHSAHFENAKAAFKEGGGMDEFELDEMENDIPNEEIASRVNETESANHISEG